MKYILNLFSAIIMSLIFMSSGIAADSALTTSSNKEIQATYKDIERTFGIVPTFLKAYPESGISAAWEEMKSVQLSKSTMLSGKVKELIGLGISAQIPCKYCVYFHTEAAKLNGAHESEIKETIAMAAATRHWSTYLNGIQYSEADFKKEIDTVINFVKKENEKPVVEQVAGTPPVEEIKVVDAKTAYQDIEKTFGSTPNFFKLFPENAVASAWKMMKSIQLNPETALSAKEKELIGLGVSAQVPCDYCVYFHTESAKLNGASTEEIRETLAMASVTRFWSTVLNGSQINEQKFKKETNQILRYVKAQTKRVGMNK